jgi:hypothetical protein
MGSTVANIIGIIVGIVWLTTAVFAVYLAIRWANSPNISTTPTELKAIRKELKNIRKILGGDKRK